MGVLFLLSFSAAVLFLGMHRGQCARIVGGRVSDPHSRPYMAAIFRRNHFNCGGTLIQRNWVLTAAHCHIKHGDKVILGAHSLSKRENGKQEFQVAKVFYHKDYTEDIYEHDIMLLQLKGRAKLSRSVKLIRLPTISEDVRAGTQCLVPGWGQTHIKRHTQRESDVLQEINVRIVDRHSCQKSYSYFKMGAYITANKLCAVVRNGGPCSGDSGGPLVCGKIQRGITSFGPPVYCAYPNVPDAYTHFTKEHIRWINRYIRR